MATTMRTLPILAVLLALAGCSASSPDPGPTSSALGAVPVAAAVRTYSGWYIQQETGDYFQPCGESTRFQIDSAELRSRASAFGLGRDNPVYVRVLGHPSGKEPGFIVSNVEAFGSATPIHDCPMTGLTIAFPG